MNHLDNKPPEQPQTRTSSVKPWLIAAAVAAVVGVAIVIIDREGEDTALAGEPVELALAFIEARNRHDAPAMVSLFAPEAQISGDLAEDPSRLPIVAALEGAVGMEYQSAECLDSSIEDSTRVFCTFELESDWSRALGRDPISGNNLRFLIEDGKIQNLSTGLNFSGLAALQQGFTDWLETNHPEAVALIFREEGIAAPRPILTPEAVDHLARYNADFVDAMTGESSP